MDISFWGKSVVSDIGPKKKSFIEMDNNQLKN